MKLLDRYQINGEGPAPVTHYEYALDMPAELRHDTFSAAAVGVRLTERWVSDILERELEFCMIHACRFFDKQRLTECAEPILDLSVREAGRGLWAVTVEVTDGRRPLIELCGTLAAVAARESSVAGGEGFGRAKSRPGTFPR